ncbi:hypothetical protein [Dawidia soli]|uniref:Uncharacterized protein n=1 Tax=Dawidia soli TaxID=2782352 RepID=A0AAP2DAA7_9BACT|nr:hypothetical protein [Dawidia soli]MBT1687386.1 hypothetical protein [Dawidia soli]
MHNVIDIKPTSKLEDVDLYYVELYRYIKQNATVHVRLPRAIKKHYFGLVPALIQFAFTWVRYGMSGKLILPISADANRSEIDELYENELIYPLLALVWNKNEPYDKSGTVNLRSTLRKKNLSVFENMKKVKAFKGYKIPLISSDHLPGGVLPIFESNSEFKNEDEITESLKPAINEMLKYSLSLKIEYNDVLKDLKEITYELMKNTFEWGRTDESNIALDPNLRGVIFKFYKNRRRTLISDFKSNPGVLTYLTSKSLKENTQEELSFIELSVFDSGVGFIDKYKALNYDNLKTEVDIIKTCMIKHNTSAAGIEKEDKGIGLDRVLKTLNRKGFLRIRTGTLCLYRDLITHEYTEIEKGNVAKMELFDWKNNSNDKFAKLPKTIGSVITILYPLFTQ